MRFREAEGSNKLAKSDQPKILTCGLSHHKLKLNTEKDSL